MRALDLQTPRRHLVGAGVIAVKCQYGIAGNIISSRPSILRPFFCFRVSLFISFDSLLTCLAQLTFTHTTSSCRVSGRQLLRSAGRYKGSRF
jgi:hypothetical protein